MSKRLLFNENGGLGGGTVLWENENTSSAFTKKTVTLSQPHNKFKYIGIVYKHARNAPNDNYREIIVREEDFDREYGSGSDSFYGAIGMYNADDGIGTRHFRKNGVDGVYFSEFILRTGEQFDTRAIPLRIVGY